MNKGATYKKPTGGWEDFEELQNKSKISWSKSKDDVWAAMEDSFEEQAEAKTIVRRLPIVRYVAAASVILLLGLTTVLRFYSESYETNAGERLAVNLPDGSTVELNAETTLKYYPLWWNIERRLQMTGEAFFDVEKGNRFVVKSENGKTRVLGTSFKIYSRNEDYRVNCITGRVQVKAAKGKVILHPNEKAILVDGRGLKISQGKNTEVSTRSWKDGKFFYTKYPLKKVMEEIERQYKVEIAIDDTFDFLYTGDFSKEEESIDDVMYKVVKPFSLTYVKMREGEYQIKKQE